MEPQGGNSNWILGLVVVLVCAQVLVLGLSAYFGYELVQTNRSLAETGQRLLKNNDVMINEIMPAVKYGISSLKSDTSEILNGVSTLQQKMTTVDQHLGQVRSDVSSVDKNFGEFTGRGHHMFWGNSLNPYILIALLAIACLNLPVTFWLFTKLPGLLQSPQTVRPEQANERLGDLERKLHGLSYALEKAKEQYETTGNDNSEYPQLLKETERFIANARLDITDITYAMASASHLKNEPERVSSNAT
jgi:hypothetical protein